MVKYREIGTGLDHTVTYIYNGDNNLSSVTETINGTGHTTGYGYDEDNRVTSVTNGSASEHYTYDSIGRVNQTVTKQGDTSILTKSYTFTEPEDTFTSTQIATSRLQATGYDVTYTYTYDDNGNILSISDGTYTTSYAYDSANQLIRENNEKIGLTFIWEYDNAGNILSRSVYGYTTGAVDEEEIADCYTYGYSTGGMGDLLTEYSDGYSDRYFTYDAIGNPLYDGQWTYTWEHGRELKTMSANSITWTYTYDANGMRTQRTNGTTTYTYIYNGSQLSQMTVTSASLGNCTLYFTYSADGTPMTVTCNGTTYYYVTNIQGDVVAILNAAGNSVVTYTHVLPEMDQDAADKLNQALFSSAQPISRPPIII